MKKGVIGFLFVAIFATNLYSQTRNAVQLADSLMRYGNLKAALTAYEFPSEIVQLQSKALTNLRNNPKFADKYIVTMVEKGATDLTFDKTAYGLTEAEFSKMISGFKAGKMPIYSDTARIVISKTNGVITFKTSGKLSSFNYLSINTKTRTINFDNSKSIRELEVSNKFYAPGVKGYETFFSIDQTKSKKLKGMEAGGLTVGVSKADSKLVMCLMYQRVTAENKIVQPDFLIVTLL